LKELLQADVKANLYQRQLLECKFGAESAVSAGVSRYPTLSRLRLRYILDAASLEGQAGITTKGAKFEQIKFHSSGYFPREVSC